MRNVDRVKVLVIIKKIMKKYCQIIKTNLLFRIQFILYSFIYYYISCCLYYINFGVNYSKVFINNLVDIRNFTVYFVYCSIDIK